ncbi:MAG: hypothetical protein WBL52_02280 [Bacillota bacterium]|nr:hypothetical protein [Candidatus Fermentithermobacillaceae bacterium]HAF66164.1 hypothetical protein [Clostridiales bacterium UBA9857]HOA71745.1 hypothetical protein [Bacillota bacterium]HOP71353.1 hypothetical protein [Bacillota bacterium]HPT36477.1 hypothetical protein [Bacillota bacterium]
MNQKKMRKRRRYKQRLLWSNGTAWSQEPVKMVLKLYDRISTDTEYHRFLLRETTASNGISVTNGSSKMPVFYAGLSSVPGFLWLVVIGNFM